MNMDSGSGLGALRVLVIDDNAQMRTIIGTVLGAAGIRNLHYAQDGRAGLDTLVNHAIDIVYVDLEMPLMNGLSFIKAARTLGGDKGQIPIIMLTGHCDTPSVLHARDNGVNEFLGKPVTARSILSRLEAVIYRPRAFVITKFYRGPDRRRRTLPGYAGPKRRHNDVGAFVEL